MMKYLILFISVLGSLSALADDDLWRLERQQKPIPSQTGELGQLRVTPLPMQNHADALTLSLLRAINGQDTATLKRLLSRYRLSVNYDPDMLLFAQASLAMQEGQLSLAIQQYETLVQRHPNFARGKLDLARLLFVDYQNRASIRYFHELMSEVSHPVVRSKIMQFSQALEQRQAWQGTLSWGTRYQSNANLSSATTIYKQRILCTASSANGRQCLPVPMPVSTPKQEAVHGLTYEATAQKRMSLTGHHGIRINTYALGSLYQKSRFNEHLIGVSAGYDYQNYDYRFAVMPLYRLAFSGTSLQKSVLGIRAELAKQWHSSGTYTALQGEQQYEYYHRPNYRHFDGAMSQILGYVAQPFGKTWYLYGVYDFTYKHTLNPVDTYHRHTLRLGAAKTFNDWQLNAELSYKATSYHAYSQWYEVRRQDKTWVYQLEVKLPKWKRLGIQPEIRYSFNDNHSNSWIYRFRNHDLSMKFSYAY